MFLNNFPTFKIYFHGIIAVFFSGMAWEISNFQIGFLKYIWFILLSLMTSSLEFFSICFDSASGISPNTHHSTSLSLLLGLDGEVGWRVFGKIPPENENNCEVLLENGRIQSVKSKIET